MDVRAPKPKRSRAQREPAPTTPDPIEIAMEAEAGDARADSPARTLLVNQNRLVGEQIALTRHERWRSKVGLVRDLALIAGLASLVIGALGMVWNASRADGLVIKAFSVPPSLAEKGVTGEMVASGLMDRLTAISATARGADRQRRVIRQGSDAISIEVPETGLSLSQVDQWLRQKLGHERQVSGELVVGDDGGLTLIARSGAEGLPPQTGRAGDLAVLLQGAAEALYAREQPDSYAGYLSNLARWQDGADFARSEIASRSQATRAHGYFWLGNFVGELESQQAERAAYQRALALDPVAALRSHNNLAIIESLMGHPEAADALHRRYLGILSSNDARDGLTPSARRQRLLLTTSSHAMAHGDFTQALAAMTPMLGLSLEGFSPGNSTEVNVVLPAAGAHDIGRASAVLATFEPQNPPQVATLHRGALDLAVAREDWTDALQHADAILASYAAYPDKGAGRVSVLSRKADLLVKLGRLDEAQAVIGATPLDCQPCVLSRGALAAAKGQPAIADHWYGEAVKMAPTLPQASYDWGKVLLARGDTAGAMAHFQDATLKGPHWADPLERWGEALLAKGDASGAARKFEAADKFAPNWGRLHLKWGEALAKLGRASEARTHWRTASGLYLTPPEREALAANLAGKV